MSMINSQIQKSQIPVSEGQYTICMNCDAGGSGKWICTECSFKCHRDHGAILPSRKVINIQCQCVCGHNNSDNSNSNKNLQIHEPTRRRWMHNQNAMLSDRIFNLGATAGAASQQQAPQNFNEKNDRFSSGSRRRVTTGGNNYILDRQLSSMDTYSLTSSFKTPNVSQLTDPNTESNTDYDMYDGTQIAADDDGGGISITAPGSKHQQVAEYQFFKHNPNSVEHTNMSGKNLTPCGLTALSLADNSNKGAVVGGFSIAYLLTLLYRCSKGDTERELRTMIGVGNVSSDVLFRQVDLIDTALRRSGVFKSYNVLLFSVPIRDSFSKIAERVSIVGSEQWQTVNLNISNLTNGLIPSAIKYAPTSSLCLINAIYFKSLWKKQFMKASTTPMMFTGLLATRQVPMMMQKDTCRYMVADGIGELLELDYQDGEFCMGFILPISSFTLGKIADIDQSRFTNCDVNYKIPRFTQRSKTELTTGYKQLGIKRLFTNPELPYITASTGSSEIFHEAVVIVDEQGTEAAAVTGILSYSQPGIDRSINFVLNRSFYYYIRHKPTDTIIFTGHYM